MKRILTAAVVSSLLFVGSVQANGLKSAIATTKDVFNYVLNGTLKYDQTVALKQLQWGAKAEGKLLYFWAQTAKGDRMVVVSRSQSPVMTQMNIDILQPLDAAAQKVLANMPSGHLLQGQLSDSVLKEISKTEVKAIGVRAWENLNKIDGVKTVQMGLDELAPILKQDKTRLKELTVGIPQRSQGVIADIAGEGPAATFRLEVGLPPTATAEQIEAVLRAVAEAF